MRVPRSCSRSRTEISLTGDLMIVVDDSQGELDGWFHSCLRVAEIECPYCMPMMDAKAVFVCREPRRPLRELWPELKQYR